ncbi:hypothetical protein UA08_05115 [Talaromyces atroroseus]|uniref:Uncharacterized protein n=1 Tax=Talaromyces atroroseus TaxID=1441469 RepID=A0A225AR19_TALAT|nr:hypothetical protein UA08_05115 [Talaromyces atroroseus]OKL59708.1 hypothetical protein UA08_05115 [Talaromyces atroroseus]
MSDEYWDKDGGYTKAAGDTNAYVTGRIGHHNVVMAFVPGMGKGAAAGVAGDLRSSYPQVKLALVVGGVQVPSPSWTNEVRIEGEVEASVVSGTLANTGGINIGKKKKENKKDSSNESVSAPNQDGLL